MTTLYLIRHSKKNYKVIDFTLLDGGFNHDLIPLSINGEELARNLANSKSLKDIDVIYSSPTLRTINTIKYFAERNDLDIILTNDIIERKIGNTKTLNGDNLNPHQCNDFDFKCPGGESFNETKNRMLKHLEMVLKEHKDKNIIFSTHKTALSLLIHHFSPDFDLYNRKKNVEAPCIYKLTFDGNKFIKYEKINIQ